MILLGSGLSADLKNPANKAERCEKTSRSAPIRSIITSHCRFRCVLIGTDAAPLCQTPMMPRASDDRLGLGRSAVVKCILKYSGQEPKLVLLILAIQLCKVSQTDQLL